MARPAEIPGAVIAGTYRLVRPLSGEGGRVYEARHDRLSGRFAVKLFAEVEPRAFLRSAQLASALRHSGVVQVIDYGTRNGQAFVVMEFIEGQPLSQLIAHAGLLPADRVARLIDSAASALKAAHGQGVCHGHLSPERIFVVSGAREESTKVVGFGLGHEISATPELTELTPYTAPEQVSDEADPRSDQFALGAIAYEMLTGVPPFDDSTERQEPPSIRDYAPEVNVIVDDVVRRALAPAAEDRWTDVAMFAHRLREAGDGASPDEKTRIAGLPQRPTSDQFTPTMVEHGDVIGTPPDAPLPDRTQVTSMDQVMAMEMQIDLGTPQPQTQPQTQPPPHPVPGPPERPRRQPAQTLGRGLVLPPPAQAPRPAYEAPPLAVHATAPWRIAPGPTLAIAHERSHTAVARTAPPRAWVPSGRVVLVTTAALIALAVVKMDGLERARGWFGGVSEPIGAPAVAAPVVAVPAAPPTVVTAPVVTVLPTVAAEPAAAAPGTSKPLAAGALPTTAAAVLPLPAQAQTTPPRAADVVAATGSAAGAQPEVVPLPANAAPAAGLEAVAAAPRPKHRAAVRHKRVPAALPPELAAEEALLLGDAPPAADDQPRARAKPARRGKRSPPPAAPATTEDEDPFAQ
jgi:serine/threonine protein kinase